MLILLAFSLLRGAAGQESKLCVDAVNTCPELARRGYCPMNSMVFERCAKSCNNCPDDQETDTEVLPGCEDTHSQCDRLSKDYCGHDLVRARCKHSCKVPGCVAGDKEGKWGEWEEWGACDRKCEMGSRFRMRICDKEPCHGDTEEKERCLDKEGCKPKDHCFFQAVNRRDCDVAVNNDGRVCVWQDKGYCDDQRDVYIPKKCEDLKQLATCRAILPEKYFECVKKNNGNKDNCKGLRCMWDDENEMCRQKQKEKKIRCPQMGDNCSRWNKSAFTLQEDEAFCRSYGCKWDKNKKSPCRQKVTMLPARGRENCIGYEPSGWTDWSEWDQCTVKCGGGTRSRMRKCDEGYGPCEGESTFLEPCNQGKCVDCMTATNKNKCRKLNMGCEWRYKAICDDPDNPFEAEDCEENVTKNQCKKVPTLAFQRCIDAGTKKNKCKRKHQCNWDGKLCKNKTAKQPTQPTDGKYKCPKLGENCVKWSQGPMNLQTNEKLCNDYGCSWRGAKGCRSTISKMPAFGRENCKEE